MPKQISLKRVVITGIGAITPIGSNATSYIENLLKGTSGAADITLFDTTEFKTKFACEVKGYNPGDYFDRKEIKKIDRFSQFGMIAADEAITDSGLSDQNTDPNDIGVILGSGIGGIHTYQVEVGNYVKGNGIPRFSPFFIPKMIPDMASGLVSIKHGYTGMNYSTVSACASSANAIIDAFNYIRLGMITAVVTGGSEATICESGIAGFNSLHALSTRNETPSIASRPFDKDRDGFVMGEGAGVIILEELEHALARGAKIYGEICGAGMTADAHHITAPHPDGAGATRVMAKALEDADIQPKDIDHINMHGTSTPLGDIAESKAILKVFGNDAYNINLNSTKSMTGHLLGASGAVELIANLASIMHDKIPPTINQHNGDENIDSKLNFTFNEAQYRKVNYCMCNTFGFGGHNTSIISKRFEG